MKNFVADIVGTRSLGDNHVLTLDLVPELSVFEGHFPGDPILAGVVQVHWAITYAMDIFGPFGEFQGMEQVKFFSLIRSGDLLDLRLAYDHERSRLKFEYLSGDELKSSGTIVFGKEI